MHQSYQSNPLKPRFNRGNPLARENIRRASEPQNTSGLLSATKATIWKPVSQQTMGELASMGKLSPKAIQNALSKGLLKPASFKRVFWENTDIQHPTSEQMNLINCFADVLI